MVSELLRNVLEHSGSPTGAFICAQYYPESRKVGLGVADSGIGVRNALSHFHPTPDDASAIILALRPGITGTSARFGGAENNAGAGLFYTKSLAVLSRTHMTISSGTGFYKLLKDPARNPITIRDDSRADRHRLDNDIPPWQGTAIGIDIGVPPRIPYSRAMVQIANAFQLHLRTRRKKRHRKPRFR